MQKAMYPAQVNSLQTELAVAINAVQTTITLVDASVVPVAPNLLTIGTDDAAETILYTGKSGNNLTGVTRGFQGTAQSWSLGTKVTRFFTAYDADTFRENIEDHTVQLTDIKNKTTDVLSFGADPTGVLDSTAAFNNALNNKMYVRVPEGIYKINGTITLKKVGQKLIGDGIYATRLIASTSNLPLIVVPDGFSQVEVSDMLLSRAVPAVSGGHGLVASGVYSFCTFERMTIEDQFIGMLVGAADIGTIKDISITKCYYDGLYMTNNGKYNNCQWLVSNILLSGNNGNGASIIGSAAATGMSLGKWSNINTFGNNGCGIGVTGSVTCPIYGFRLASSFLGGDGNFEILLNTYGGMHTIKDVFIEYCGTSPTGRMGETPPTNSGSGIAISANNVDCLITDCYLASNSANGISSEAVNITISNCISLRNGLGNMADYKNGIAIYAGKAIISSNRSQENERGLYCVDGSKVSITANDFTLNTAAPLLCVANQHLIITASNKPISLNVESVKIPTLLNSWANVGGGYSTAGYWKDAMGIVRLKGRVTGGVVNESIFVLPSGYRPLETIQQIILSNGTTGVLFLNSSGFVSLMAGSNVYACLDGVTFKADL